MEKAITSPKLPPIYGYVEVEIDGVRQYRETPEHAEARAREKRLSSVDEVLNTLLGVNVDE